MQRLDDKITMYMITSKYTFVKKDLTYEDDKEYSILIEGIQRVEKVLLNIVHEDFGNVIYFDTHGRDQLEIMDDMIMYFTRKSNQITDKFVKDIESINEYKNLILKVMSMS